MDTEPIPTDHFDNIVLPPKKPRSRAPRLTSKDQIIAKIDKFTAKARSQRVKAEELIKDAKTLRSLSAKEEMNSAEADKLSASATRKEEHAQAWGKKAARIEDRVLAPLKQKLSEFQTDVMPGFLPDNSVEGV